MPAAPNETYTPAGYPAAGAGDDRSPVAVMVANLIWRVLSERHGQPVLEWAGLTALPLHSKPAIAPLHGLDVDLIYHRIAHIRRIASQRPIPPAIRAEASRRTRGDEDHEARTRQAHLLGFPPPAPPAPAQLSQSQWHAARRAAEVLAALGPLPIDELTACLQRTQNRRRRQLTARDVTLLLLTSGLASPGDDDRWAAAADITAPPAYLALLQAAEPTDRAEHTWEQMLALLQQAGYTTGGGATITYHPLLLHLGVNRWAVRQPTAQSGSGNASGN